MVLKKEKTKLFLDFDNVITNSTCSAYLTYSEIYGKHRDFKKANWEDNKRWDMSDICPLANGRVDKLFGHPYFFKTLQFMNKETPIVIKRLSEFYDIAIVTIGCPENIALKSEWIAKNLPFINSTILLQQVHSKPDKSMVQMNYPDSIFIDDVYSNLMSSNAQTKYTIGPILPWNQQCEEAKIHRFNNWNEIEEVLYWPQKTFN